MKDEGLVMNKNLLIRYVLLILLLVMGLASCATPPPLRPLRVAWIPFPGYYPLLIAQEKVFFAKHGASVEPVAYENIADVYIDLAAGKIDGTCIPLGEALRLEGRNPGSLRAVLAIDHSVGADAIIASPEVKGPADLVGKKVGVSLGTFGELLARTMFEANGIQPGDVTFVNVAPEDMLRAIPDEVDAGHVWEPYLSQGKAQGLNVLYTSAAEPGLISDVVVFQKHITENHAEELRGFTAGWFEALEWQRDNPAESSLFLAQLTNQPVEAISTEGLQMLSLEDNVKAFTSNADFTSLYSSAQANVAFYVRSGMISSEPNITQFLDASFLR